jgi:ABC-type branched-subunit amino acid transport system ATPase component
MFGYGALRVPRPVIGPFDASNDATFYGVALALFLCALALTAGIRKARLGRLLRALGDSPVALMTQGTTINITKVAVFCVSAFFAGIGGALITAQNGFLSADPFASINSLTVVVVVLTLRIGQPLSALAAATAYAVVPSFLNGTAPVWWLDIGFGAAAVITAVSVSAEWLPRWRWAPRAAHAAGPLWTRRPAATTVPTAPAPVTVPADAGVAPAAVPAASGGMPDKAGLEVRGLSVRFRAVVAVDDVSLVAPMGRITGLIGPNGAGKTTTFNFCSGLVQPVAGRLLLHGRDVTATGPAARARHGLGRTFQLVDLFASLTVRENVELGREGAMAGAHLLTHVVAAPGQPAQIRAAATAAMDLVGITGLAEREIGTLSTGEKRLVELARCLAGSFDVLLLDEPSAGLDSNETRRFSDALRRVVGERGVGVLLVEHDMAMVMRVCDHLYVLDFGRLIFSGTPEETMRSEVVRAAYLGVEQDTRAPAGLEPGPR